MLFEHHFRENPKVGIWICGQECLQNQPVATIVDPVTLAFLWHTLLLVATLEPSLGTPCAHLAVLVQKALLALDGAVTRPIEGLHAIPVIFHLAALHLGCHCLIFHTVRVEQERLAGVVTGEVKL